MLSSWTSESDNTAQQGINTCHKEVEQTTRNKRVATRPKHRVHIYCHMLSFHYSQAISTVSRTFLVENHFYSTKPWSMSQALLFINDWSISPVQRRPATQSLATVIQTDINRTCSRSNQYTSASVICNIPWDTHDMHRIRLSRRSGWWLARLTSSQERKCFWR